MSEKPSCPTPSSCACATPSTSSTPSTESKPTATSTSAPAAGAIQNGKGDAPRNISTKFRKNYDGIKWSFGGKDRQEGGKFIKKYA